MSNLSKTISEAMTNSEAVEIGNNLKSIGATFLTNEEPTIAKVLDELTGIIQKIKDAANINFTCEECIHDPDECYDIKGSVCTKKVESDVLIQASIVRENPNKIYDSAELLANAEENGLIGIEDNCPETCEDCDLDPVSCGHFSI